jgi:hypothetical protein
VSEDQLRAAIEGLPPGARDKLRRVLVMDFDDRNEVAQELLRYRDLAGLELADLIDRLTLNDEERRRVVRLITKVEAAAA